MSLTVAHRFRGPKVYRFLLFGAQASGKTSILAALGMGPDRTSAAGYACVRQTTIPGRPRPPGAPESWTGRELNGNPVKAFYRGNQWINEATRELRTLNPAPANPNNTPPLLLVYSLTIPGHGQVTIEISDFAGELMRPNPDPGKNARALEQVLGAVDGLLVLAEATAPGTESAPDFRTLAEAFLKWSDSRKDGPRLKIPVALLFNKWDRRGKTAASPAERAQEVTRFLEDSEIHRNLSTALENVTERFGQFAVSAFGSCTAERDDQGRSKPNTDRPAEFPLRSYGLEEPFAWAVAQVDEADLNRLVADAQAMRLWRPGTPAKVWRTANRLRRRLRDDAPAAGRIAELAGRARRLVVRQAVLSLLLILVLGLAIELTFDGVRRGQALGTLHNPTASHEQIEQAFDWLEAYAASSWPRHRLMKIYFRAADAGDLVRDERSRRDTEAWRNAIKEGPGLLDRLEDYLARFPNGGHADEAKGLKYKILRDIEKEERRRENREALYRVRDKYKSAEVGRDEENLAAVYEEFRRLPPHPEAESQEDARTREKLGAAITDTLARVIKNTQRREWVRERLAIDQKIQTLELGDVVRRLNTFKYELPDVQDYRATFAARAITAARGLVDRAISTRTWDDLLPNMETAVNDTDWVRLARAEERAELGRQLARLREDKDQQLYEDFCRARGDANRCEKAKRYQHGAPERVMAPVVKAWMEWHDKMRNPVEVAFEMVVVWGDWDERKRVRIELGVNNNRVIDQIEPSAPGEETKAIRSTAVDLVPTELCNLKVHLRTEDKYIWVGSRHEADKEFIEFTAVALDGSQSLLVDDGLRTRVWIACKGLPEQPVLRAWTRGTE